MSARKKRKKWDLDYKIVEVRGSLLFFIVMFTIPALIRLYFVPILPQLEYFNYQCNTDKYVIVNADVIYSHEITVLETLRGSKYIICRSNTVQYVIDGVEYTGKTYAYPDVKEPKGIKIAVNINDATKIKRCIEYHWDGREKRATKVEMMLIAIFLVLFLITNHFVHKKEKEYAGEYYKKHPLKEEKSFDGQVAEKKLYILEHMPQWNVSEDELQERIEGITEKGIKFNSGTLWLLMYYGKSQKILDIFNLLPLFWRGEYCNYIENLYEQGLPPDYYVLAEQGGNYYCCCEENERLYMFSRGVGITHTKYETIYDYIMEQMDNKTEG